MLTVKLGRWITINNFVNENEPKDQRFSKKVVEATEVDIHTLRPNELYEISGHCDGKYFAYYIANPELSRPEGFADEVDFYCHAFIENSNGATTEVVKF